MPDAQRSIPLAHVDVVTLAASAHSVAGDRGRAEVLLQRALDEVGPNEDPTRYAGLLARLSRIQWSLNRGLEAAETAQRALSMLPPGESSREHAHLLAWLARMRYLRGRFREAVTDGEAALTTAIEVGDQAARAAVLNTLGMAQISLGNVDEGVDLLLRAIQIAQAADDPENLGYAYSNLADMLGLAGRTTEALKTAREGLARVPRRMSLLHDWMMVTVAQLAFEAGDWELARTHLAPPAAALDPQSIFRLLVEAELALGAGAEELAGRRLDEAEPLVGASTEPQWIGWFGALRGELLRRRRDLLEARATVEHALGRLEVCTDDVMRIARASAVGARVKADVAQRARDLRERADEREAVARLRIHASRLAAAAQAGGPVEKAWQAAGKAELARGRRRNDAALWRRAAVEWDAIARPYQAAILRWREAEAGERSSAETALRAALTTARRLGARWLAEEVRALAHRARLELSDGEGATPESEHSEHRDGAEDPFGLTPRERQVLALIAEGATNRQIGAALFMAEKTASVHVSRILSKLGVQSRTQAAAVAHRLQLTN